MLHHRPPSQSATRPNRDTDRTAALASFYEAHADWVRGGVYKRVNALDHTVIDDACSFAWTALCRRPDIGLDAGGAAWVTTVAIREGWRLCRERREVPGGDLRGDGDWAAYEAPEPADLYGDPESLVIARDEHSNRAADLAKLKPAQQRDLLLHASGFNYEEIAELTSSTVTAVNRRLSEGRARLRVAARRRAAWEGR